VIRARPAWDLLPRDRECVVAVSGGPDSTALLVAAAPRRRVVAAHFNHALRGAEADADAEFVRELAERLGVPFVTEKADPPAGPDENTARKARYAFLTRVARQRGCPVVAVAHTADDQAETFLMRLIRGSGTLGLGAMAPARCLADGILLVRPFLTVTRDEILAYLRRKRVGYRVDATNFDTTRLRARIRAELLPQLRTYNPRIVEVLCRTAAYLREDQRRLRAGEARV
jgi:tRNA(Ile)-lysidine synthase